MLTTDALTVLKSPITPIIEEEFLTVIFIVLYLCLVKKTVMVISFTIVTPREVSSSEQSRTDMHLHAPSPEEC